MSESQLDRIRSEQSVEITTEPRWWFGLLFAAIMLFSLIMAIITDPTFIELSIGVVVLIGFIVFIVVDLTITFLCRKIVKRFSVDMTSRSLIYETFGGSVRVFKKVFPFETIDKFEIIYRNIRKSKYHSVQRIKFLALTLQSGMIKYLSSPRNEDNVKMWASQLNLLLQDQGGFLAERFFGALTPHWPPANRTYQKALIFSVFAILFIGIMVIIMVLLGIL